MAVREESYAEFSRRVHGRAAGKRIPVNIDYDVTYRCNLNCRHCYCNLPADDGKAKEKELELDEITRILTEARDLGALWILLTGGEPLLRPDFRDIYLAALRLGLIPTVFTNGTLVTEEWADFFAEFRPFRIEVTLYGSNAEVYERVTRTPGSFERCMRGIRLLRGRGLPLRLKTMVLRSNLEDMDRIRALSQGLGVPFKLDPVLHARYPDLPRTGGLDSRDERIPLREIIRVDREDPERAEAWPEICAHLMDRRRGEAEGFLGCGAGRYAVHVGADGTVRPCGSLRFMGWSTKESGFSEIWLEGIPRRLAAPRRDAADCEHCNLLSLCGQCPGWAWIETGCPSKKVDYLCAVAHARAVAFAPSEGGTADGCREEEAVRCT